MIFTEPNLKIAKRKEPILQSHTCKINRLIVIGGPTASGKSDVAIELAKILDGEIVNADSVQIYKGMDIGSAKPPQSVRMTVPHHLFDVATLDDPWDVKTYEVAARTKVEEIFKRGKIPIVVGGSGFYIKGLLCGVPEETPKDEKLRKILTSMDRNWLLKALQKLDPERARELHPNDTKRIVRAVEMCLLTGRPASSFKWQEKERWKALKIAIIRPSEELKKRIYQRVETMMEMGWLEETKQLAESYGYQNRILNSTLGYRELMKHLKRELSLDQAVSLIKRETYKYAKRQKTWFRGEGFVFVRPDVEEIAKQVKRWLND